MTTPDPFAGAEGNLGPDKALSEPITKPRATKKAERVEHPDDRTEIVLEDNADIPPTGQFFGVQGRGYILRPGEPAKVPDALLNILDTAVGSVPIKNAAQTIIGYRDRLRFPYRIVTERRKAD